MTHLPALPDPAAPPVAPGEITLLHAPAREAMLTLTARLALLGPVCVIDTGNQFDAYQVARIARRHTAALDPLLSRIGVARAFTCYQTVTLFEQLPPTAANRPIAYIIFNLPATFYDENITTSESYRLMAVVAAHLQRLRQTTAAIVLSAHPPRRPARAGLLNILLDLADRTYDWSAPAVPTPGKLNL